MGTSDLFFILRKLTVSACQVFKAASSKINFKGEFLSDFSLQRMYEAPDNSLFLQKDWYPKRQQPALGSIWVLKPTVIMQKDFHSSKYMCWISDYIPLKLL